MDVVRICVRACLCVCVCDTHHACSKGIFHRDIKPENILVRGDIHTVPIPFPNANPASPYHLTTSFPIVKLADFGSCRGIHSKMPYTEYIATRWYRSPECLLFDGVYTYKMDVWGIGCVFFELVTKVPLFPGDDEVDQLHKIHHVLGTPSDRLLKAMVASGQNAILNGVASNGSGTNGTNPQQNTNTNTTTSSSGTQNATSKDGKAAAVKGIFKKKFAFPPTKGTGLKAAFPPHILHGASKINPKHAGGGSSSSSSSTGYSATEYPGLSDECVHLIELLLQYDPDARPTARHALKHPWLKECRDAEASEKQQHTIVGGDGSKPLANLPMVAGSNVAGKLSNVGTGANGAQAAAAAAAAAALAEQQQQALVDPLKAQIKRRTKNVEKPPAVGELGAEGAAAAAAAAAAAVKAVDAGYKPVLAAGSSMSKNAVAHSGAAAASHGAGHGAAVEEAQVALGAMNIAHPAGVAGPMAALKKNINNSNNNNVVSVTDATSLAEALLSPTIQAKLNGLSKRDTNNGGASGNTSKVAVAPGPAAQQSPFKAFVGGAAMTLAPQQQQQLQQLQQLQQQQQQISPALTAAAAATHAGSHPPLGGSLVAHAPTGLPAMGGQAAPAALEPTSNNSKFGVDLTATSLNRGKFTNPIPLLAKDLKKQPSGTLPPTTKRIPLAGPNLPAAINGQPALSGFAITNGLASVVGPGASSSSSSTTTNNGGIQKEKLPSITGAHAPAVPTQQQQLAAVSGSNLSNNVHLNAAANGSINNAGNAHVSGTTAIKGAAALPSLNGKKPLPPMSSATSGGAAVTAAAAPAVPSHASEVRPLAVAEVKSVQHEVPATNVPSSEQAPVATTKSPSVPQLAQAVTQQPSPTLVPDASATTATTATTDAAGTSTTTTDTTTTTTTTTAPPSLPATYIVESSVPQNTKLLGLKQQPPPPQQQSSPPRGDAVDLPSQQQHIAASVTEPVESSVAQPDGPGRPIVDTAIGAGNPS